MTSARGTDQNASQFTDIATKPRIKKYEQFKRPSLFWEETSYCELYFKFKKCRRWKSESLLSLVNSSYKPRKLKLTESVIRKNFVNRLLTDVF